MSWYEAAAYAESVGKALPTVRHWAWAAGTDIAASVTPLSNISGSARSPVGQYPGLGHYGTYDMAGNAREWVWNESQPGDDRYILGGAWNEPGYTFVFPQALSPFDRSATNGFRLVWHDDEPPADVFSRPIAFPSRDYTQEEPVSEEVFRAYNDFYSYDPSSLEDRIESTDDTAEHWRLQKVSFEASYKGERVAAYLFLPKNAEPPYQTVLFFPGSDALRTSSSQRLENLGIEVFDFLLDTPLDV